MADETGCANDCGILGIEGKFDTKSATDIRRNHPDFGLVDAEYFGDPGPEKVRSLMCGPDVYLVSQRVPIGHQDAPFERDCGTAAVTKFHFNHKVRPCKSCLDVAVHDAEMIVCIAPDCVVNERGARSGRGF